MFPIQEQQWGQVSIHTWGDLSTHLWECFRLALMEAETEQEVQGVVVKYSKALNDVVTVLEIQGVKIVQSPTIMGTTTEMIVNIVVSKRDYKSAMLGYLPWYEKKSDVFNHLINAYDREFRRIEQSLDVVDRNLFIDTAIELLHIYERDLGITPLKSLKFDQRREQISSRYRAAFDQTTNEAITTVASAYGNGEVEIKKTDIDGVYEIKFVGIGIPNNLEGLKKAIDIIIPAHIEVKYAFTFNTWEFVSNKTWGESLSMNWNDLRTWEGVS